MLRMRQSIAHPTKFLATTMKRVDTILLLLALLCLHHAEARPKLGHAFVQMNPPVFTDMMPLPKNEMGVNDIVSIHDDVYGIPWEHFRSNGSIPLPTWWVDKMNWVKNLTTDWGSPIFLSLSFLDGTRICPGYNTTTNGDPYNTQSWNCDGNCFDYTPSNITKQITQAYIAYAKHQIQFFQPTYVNYAIELNLYYHNCPSMQQTSWPALKAMCNEVYTALKANFPSIVFFPSFGLYKFEGMPAQCNTVEAAHTDYCINLFLDSISNISRDRFAMSTYPQGYYENFTQYTWQDWGDKWFSAVLDKINETGVVAETGFLNDDIVINAGDAANPNCVNFFPSNTTMAASWLNFSLYDSTKQNMDLYIWWSDRDWMPAQISTSCPCNSTGLDPGFCDIVNVIGTSPAMELSVKAFATMGVRGWDGTPRQNMLDVLDNWKSDTTITSPSPNAGVTTGDESSNDSSLGSVAQVSVVLVIVCLCSMYL